MFGTLSGATISCRSGQHASNYDDIDSLLGYSKIMQFYRTKEKGDLINWDSFQWRMENMDESDMDYTSICKKAPNNVLLPQSMSVYDGIDQCRKFGGEMTVCSGKQMELDLIADEYFQKLVYSRKDELFALGGI